MKKQLTHIIILCVLATTAIATTNTPALAIARQPESTKAPAPVPKPRLDQGFGQI
jgi:hypothetical protein